MSAGRWKSVTVAVKIIEHSETAASAPGSAARVMDVGRESLLATSIAHPNVVGVVRQPQTAARTI